ncbi:hypothetical protein LX81_03534 [Palleronia aestuarii]|uniref:Integrase catalytic domain-containing protein n=1 Tax=Palleronia aestuarii TaxID=568105 RepID=A0A2W7N396_9RHOB|nr:Mu transposase C-terminal domain-containing protein [Palleronia aestuarii]PZX12827.1 hypothetical protein LX81_03534 [Palleronia aestuarii]
MTYFDKITKSDLVTFEGRRVDKITPIQDKMSKELTHFRFAVVEDDGNVELRKVRIEAIPHLIENETVVIDHGYFSRQRQTDRALYGSRELCGASRQQRENVDEIIFTCSLMQRFRNMGMKLTRSGVEDFRLLMDVEYQAYQSRKNYGTEKPNSKQRLKPLPSADTLLVRFRTYRNSQGDPNAFLVPRAEPFDAGLQASADFCFIVERLGGYASATRPSKAYVIEELNKDLEKHNEYRLENNLDPIEILSHRTYERWIDNYLDPYLVCLQREGLSAARKKFDSFEDGRIATVPGQIVSADAWQFHVVTLDTTREKYNRMTEEERKKVKRVRRWVVVIIDLATRCILGFSICRAPNEQASLEALRMVFMDKTYLFRDAGIAKSFWDYRCAIIEMVNDSGSEFGKTPFGGALFAQGVRTVSGTLMNTVAGIANLRGHIERYFWTLDLKLARFLPGYTANNPQRRNDRKPGEEACITDDELHIIFVSFVAEYHNTPHRGLHFRTPSAVWEELTRGHDFDITQMPSPSQLREACGFYGQATVSATGIKVAGAEYSNEIIRLERRARVVDRIAAPGRKVEIKIDPFDMGSISVLANGEMVSVPCRDPMMRGKTLREWQSERLFRKRQAEAEASMRKGARDEASDRWRDLAKSIARSADVGIHGYTQAEIDRIFRERDFGKGGHKEPYIDPDEYIDPVYGGFETEQDVFDETGDVEEEYEGDGPNSMDRFRSRSRARKTNQNRKLKK